MKIQKTQKTQQKISFLVILISLTSCQGMTPHSIDRDITGTYDVESRYKLENFNGVFAGLAGKWANPDKAIGSEIQANIRSNYGATIADSFSSIYGAQLQRDISSYMKKEAPPWINNLQQSLDGVDRQLATIDMQQSWLVAENENGDALEATQIFNGVAVFKDPNCPGSGALTCAQIEVTSQTLLNAEYPIEILSSRYSIEDRQDSIVLESNKIEFNYGRLGLYYLTNLILPDDPAEGLGLRDVVLGAINCRGLANRLAGDDGVYGVEVLGTSIGISVKDLVGNCEEGIFSTVNNFVDGFSAPMEMNLAGESKTTDINRDGRVDQITSGTLNGDMKVNAFSKQKEGPVSGFFDGFRVVSK